MDQALLDFHYQGFAKGNQEMMETLEKALSAGSGVDTAAFTGGRALIPESLDSTLVNVLWKQDEAKLFKALKKIPVKSPVHQWTRRTGVGDSDGAWVAEGGTSTEKDTDIERKYTTMKYLQTLRKVTLQATISNMLEDAMTVEKSSGTLWIIKEIEKKLFFGDSAMVSTEPDGLEKLIVDNVSTDPENIIDLRGKDATSVQMENAIGEATRVIRQKFGIATDLFMSLITMEDIQKLLRDRLRFPAGATGETVLPNLVYDKYPTPFGTPMLQPDLFILEGEAPRTSSISTGIASQVSISNAAGAHASSEFLAADAGTYYYSVAAVNKFGQGLVSAEASQAVAAGERVTISITEGGTDGTCFFIFRSKKDAGASATKLFMKKVVRTGDDPDVYDTNSDLPGTSKGFMLGMNPMYNAIEWEQFLPLMKFDLYPTNAAVYPFLMLLFGALGLKKPEQHIMIKNISPSTLGWF